jgi:hypothetical protein
LAIEIAPHRWTDGDGIRRPLAGFPDAGSLIGAEHTPIEDQVADYPPANHGIGLAPDAQEEVGKHAIAVVKIAGKAIEESPQKRAGEWRFLQVEQFTEIFNIAREATSERWNGNSLYNFLC